MVLDCDLRVALLYNPHDGLGIETYIPWRTKDNVEE
jgi:hypothetical protein